MHMSMCWGVVWIITLGERGAVERGRGGRG